MLRSHIASKLGISETKLSEIKNIIFDLGGVVIDIRYQDTINAFKELGFEDFELIYTQLKQTHLFDLLETGRIPAQAFRVELRKFRDHLTDYEIDSAWNKMIGIMPEEHPALLKSLRSKYATFLLSNTNAIHIDYFYKYLSQAYSAGTITEMFDKVYYSHEIGLRKPDTEAYFKVLRDAGIKAGETLFIDDLSANIQGAKEAGLYAYHLHKEKITDLFNFR